MLRAFRRRLRPAQCRSGSLTRRFRPLLGSQVALLRTGPRRIIVSTPARPDSIELVLLLVEGRLVAIPPCLRIVQRGVKGITTALCGDESCLPDPVVHLVELTGDHVRAEFVALPVGAFLLDMAVLLFPIGDRLAEVRDRLFTVEFLLALGTDVGPQLGPVARCIHARLLLHYLVPPRIGSAVSAGSGPNEPPGLVPARPGPDPSACVHRSSSGPGRPRK